MKCCDNLIHPFQNDPGVSQRQRIVDDLLSGSAQIDGRKLADLLQYVSQLSRHINFYNDKLDVSDWQPFLLKSLPFLLAKIIKFDKNTIEKKFNNYKKQFQKKPTRQSLQLITHFIYYQTIHLVNKWHTDTEGSELTAEKLIEKIIRDKLKEPVKQFMCFCNAAVHKHKIKKIDFNKLQKNSVWGFTPNDIRQAGCFVSNAPTRRKRIIELGDKIADLFPGLLNMMTLSVAGAEVSLNDSLLPAKEEFKEKHSPHLALLFAFLKLFGYCQNDLNSFTKKHLDFFYKDVLRLAPRSAVADKAHILFEIQNILVNHPLAKSTKVKDGKDLKKAEINFALDDEIIINKAKVAEVKTLFLNNQVVFNSNFVEGVYMAPDATKADGLEEAFTKDPKNWPTLGSKDSKYIDAEQNFIKPYPDARIGFTLASPVLLLNEGTRTITMTLDCKLHNDFCSIVKGSNEISKDKCCEGKTDPAGQPQNSNAATDTIDKCAEEKASNLKACKIYDDISDKLNKKYYYISKVLIAAAIKKGVGNDIIKKLRDFLRIFDPPGSDKNPKLCYCGDEQFRYDILVTDTEFENRFNPAQREILTDIFKPESIFKIYFSGADEWISPVETIIGPINPKTVFDPLKKQDPVCDPKSDPFDFTITITAILTPDQPAITFYNKDTLKEDLQTELPLVKIELNDHIKLSYPTKKDDGNSIFLPDTNPTSNSADTGTIEIGTQPKPKEPCCLEVTIPDKDHSISAYHFFRNVVLTNDTKIHVKVCGLKKFIVQYDNTVMDINGPIYPFGPVPDIVDFNLDHTVAEPTFPTPLPDPKPNLIGPNFYIGSKEVFLKNWQKVCVKINWKNKPVDFNDYYKAYLKREIPDPNDATKTIDLLGLNEADFQVNLALLEDGGWLKDQSAKAKQNVITLDHNRKLFAKEDCNICTPDPNFSYSFFIEASDFTGTREFVDFEDLLKYDVSTRNGFIRLNLQNQDFLHQDYAIALARQMMAMGKFPDKGVEGAIYYGTGNTVIVFKDTGTKIAQLKTGTIKTAIDEATETKGFTKNVKDGANAARNAGTLDITDAEFTNALGAIPGTLQSNINDADSNAQDSINAVSAVADAVEDIKKNLSIFDFFNNDPGKLKDDLTVPIPIEPWTPVIQNIELDYEAEAKSIDIDLIHLYPYAGTFKHEELEESPTMFPTYCDEGNLFLGLKDLVPGTNLNILFQLAEATADSESERENLVWYYLDNNEWKILREGFEVLEDATEDLTTSGIIKFATPANMTKGNTILPKDYHWIRISIPRNSRAIAETTGIHTQAILTVFTNEPENDTLRLSDPLEAGSIAKLTIADPNVKTIIQPYDSFGGREPEAERHYYVRVSELLRHKGRAIQKWDYERLILENFPQIYKAKCINHSFALDAKKFKIDFPIAPGYIILAVIPDLTKLKAGNSFEPRVPLSLLEDIEEKLRKLTSPFVRLRAMNPRYEKIDFCLKVKLYTGKDEVYYKKKLRDDIREFLAPWAIGEYSKLSFGQCVTRSDILRFLEGLDYIDYIIELSMRHERDPVMSTTLQEICPRTPRSILLAGDIDVCIPDSACDEWDTAHPCDEKPKRLHDFCKPATIIK